MTPLVIVAGGRGLRLHPLTERLPKPMVKVGDRPVIETIVREAVEQGFRRIWISLGYKGDLIRNHFENGSKLGATIRYVEEKQALGTGGALNLLPPMDRPFIVTNADILAKINYADLMEHHARSQMPLTMVAGLHQAQVRYGVADIDETLRVVALREKPVVSWHVAAGIYVLSPEAMEQAPKGRWDMPDLISSLVPNVSAYPLHDYWHDVGTYEDLGRAHAGAQ